jgi:hypothetical protein
MLLSTTLGFVYHDILADQRMPEFPENIFSTSLSTTVQLHTSMKKYLLSLKCEASLEMII